MLLFDARHASRDFHMPLVYARLRFIIILLLFITLERAADDTIDADFYFMSLIDAMLCWRVKRLRFFADACLRMPLIRFRH